MNLDITKMTSGELETRIKANKASIRRLEEELETLQLDLVDMEEEFQIREDAFAYNGEIWRNRSLYGYTEINTKTVYMVVQDENRELQLVTLRGTRFNSKACKIASINTQSRTALDTRVVSNESMTAGRWEKVADNIDQFIEKYCSDSLTRGY